MESFPCKVTISIFTKKNYITVASEGIACKTNTDTYIGFFQQKLRRFFEHIIYRTPLNNDFIKNKLRLLNCVPYVPSANVPCVLTCQRVLRAYVPTYQHGLRVTCSRANVYRVLKCSRVNVPYVLTCSRTLRAYVLTCQRALHDFCAYVPMCSSAIITNNKNKFSIICFPYIFLDCSFFLFPLK